MLEEQIARLEARIRELEHPELVAPSVTLNPASVPMLAQSPEGTSVFYGLRLLTNIANNPDRISEQGPTF